MLAARVKAEVSVKVCHVYCCVTEVLITADEASRLAGSPPETARSSNCAATSTDVPGVRFVSRISIEPKSKAVEPVVKRYAFTSFPPKVEPPVLYAAAVFWMSTVASAGVALAPARTAASDRARRTERCEWIEVGCGMV